MALDVSSARIVELIHSSCTTVACASTKHSWKTAATPSLSTRYAVSIVCAGSSRIVRCRARKRYKEHAKQHLSLLALLEQDRNADAGAAMREHLKSTARSIVCIRGLIKREQRPRKAT
jgi:hypothetical protein